MAYGTYGKTIDIDAERRAAEAAQVAGAASSLAPYTLGANLLGTALGAYGTYQQGNQAQKQYELQVRAWENEKTRQAREDEDRRQQELLNNAMAGGNYANNLVKDTGDAYGSYARKMGY